MEDNLSWKIPCERRQTLTEDEVQWKRTSNWRWQEKEDTFFAQRKYRTPSTKVEFDTKYKILYFVKLQGQMQTWHWLCFTPVTKQQQEQEAHQYLPEGLNNWYVSRLNLMDDHF